MIFHVNGSQSINIKLVKSLLNFSVEIILHQSHKLKCNQLILLYMERYLVALVKQAINTVVGSLVLFP